MIKAAFFQAIDNIRENFSTTLSGIITAAFSLIILGTIILVYQNLIFMTENFFQQNQYSVFLEEKVDWFAQRKIKNHLRSIDGIGSIHEVPAEQSRKELLESFGEVGKLLERVKFSELPNLIEFSLKRPTPLTSHEIMRIETLNGVDEIVHGQETKQQIDTFFRISNFVGLFLISLFLVCISIIVRNSIQISIRIRIKEIEILRILGATTNFIRWPYIWEGIFIGAASFLLSTLGVYFVFQFAIAGVTYDEATYGIREIFQFFTFKQLMSALLLIIVLGVYSSISATNRILQQLDV